MTRSHYLPAAYLGGFSPETGARRHRRVWVLRRGETSPSFVRVSKVFRVGNLYAPMLGGVMDLEKHWQRYEDKVPAAIELLTSGAPVDALTWVHVLVPFVTGMLLRGPEFDRRFEGRLPGMEEYMSRANTNGARVIEFQRLLAPVLAAHWVVLKSPDAEFIASDLGWVHARPAHSEEVGIAVVLGPQHVLMLAPARSGMVAAWDGDRWVAPIERGQLFVGEAASLNTLQASRADRVIIGRSPDVVSGLAEPLNGPRIAAPEPLGAWGIDRWTLVVHEFEWWRLARVVRMAPDKIGDFRLDFAVANQSDWWPNVVLPVNLPEFESGLSINGPFIALDLNEQPRPE